VTFSWRALPGGLLSLVVGALLVLFIAVPIGAMLIESTRISGPMPPQRLRAVTEAALAQLPPPRREETLARWAAAMTERQRIEAVTLALQLSGTRPNWDLSASFADQMREASAALARLPTDERAAVEALVPLAHATLHRRVALAFQVRQSLSPEAFEALRSGEEHRRGLDHYFRLFEDPFLRAAALNSLTLAAGAAVFSTTLAFALSFAINRGGVGRPALVRALLLLPLVAPPVLIATATLMLFGRRGLVTHGLLERTLGLIDANVTNLYGAGGVVIAQTLAFLPAALIVLDNVLRKQDGRIEEAAASLGASRLGIFWNVTLPMVSPGLRRAFVLTFIMSLTDFGNPLVLGRDTPVISGLIYEEITAFRNTPLAAALCVWLLVPPLLMFLALEALAGRRRFVADGSPAAPESGLPAVLRLPLGLLAWTVIGLVVLVYATVATGAFVRLWCVDWSLTLGYFTQSGVNVGFAGTGYGSSDRGLGTVWQSALLAGIAAPIGGLLGVLTAYVVERVRPPGAEALSFLAMVPAILPGVIFGVGYIAAFHVPFGVPALSLTGTGAIIVLNVLFSNLFVGVLAARGALQRLDRSIDEAGESLGAGLLARLWHITLPMMRPAFLLGTLYVFVDGLTTLSSVIFLVSGDHKLAAVAIFNHASSGEFGYAAAKSVVLMAVAGLAMILVWRLDRVRRRVVTPIPGVVHAG
jgi:iron(III) transport system permease protein